MAELIRREPAFLTGTTVASTLSISGMSLLRHIVKIQCDTGPSFSRLRLGGGRTMKAPLCCTLLLLTIVVHRPVSAQNSNSNAQATSPSGTQGQPLSPATLERISKEVRHELLLLPFYGVFDNLAYRVQSDGTVVLQGQVVRPTLKSDAENAVKRIEGVTRVVNNIEVLPVSPNDDRIRRDVYRAIYGNQVLSQYALRAVPTVHIIVKNGHATLEGAVARQMDKQIAEIQAKSVPGVFSVTNNLRVDNGS
jgi:hyperosmotically inducible protein